ncbi:MAG: DUF1476 domain-containing protein [Proteobacteria bacterium]|nr:DUF1476 domain-containing protein [Pseudomonadota bacterium]
MTTLKEREEGFESKFSHDELLKFMVMARRNKLLGYWAAQQLGLQDLETEQYVKQIVISDIEELSDEAIVRTILQDFQSKNIPFTQQEINSQMNQLYQQAYKEITEKPKYYVEDS